MDYWSIDFKKEENCWAWLERKNPFLGFNVISIFGKTSTGKSSLLCALIGAQITEIKDVPCDRAIHFVRGVNDSTFQQVTTLTKRKQPLVEDVEKISQYDERIPRLEVKPMTPEELWPSPRGSCSASDDRRYNDLFVSGSELRAAFQRVIPPKHRSLLDELAGSGARFTLFNIDRLTGDESLKRHLSRTIFVDTRGLDPGSESVSTVGANVLKWATKNVFMIPSCPLDNAAPAGLFERMMFESVFGNSWASKLKSYIGDSHRFVPAVVRLVASSYNPEVAKAAGSIADAAVGTGSNQTDVGLDELWRRTTFVRGRLDESLQSRRGILEAAENGGLALACFATRPINHRVRHVAVPQLAHDTADLEQWNELVDLKRELLESRASDDLCEFVGMFKREYQQQQKAHHTVDLKKFLPPQVANSDGWYADNIWNLHCTDAAKQAKKFQRM